MHDNIGVSFIGCLERRSLSSRPRPRFPGSPEPYVVLCCDGNSAHGLLVFCLHNLSLRDPDCLVVAYYFSTGARLGRSFDIVSARLRSCNDGFLLSSVITARTRVRSYSRIMVSVLDVSRRSCLTCCSNPDTNTHVMQRSGSGSPISRARGCKSA